MANLLSSGIIIINIVYTVDICRQMLVSGVDGDDETHILIYFYDRSIGR